MCLVGALPYQRGAALAIAQILGGMTASAIVSCLFPGPLKVVSELGGGTNIAQGLFIEMFLTAQLIFTIFMLAAEKHRETFIAPIGIGLSLFIAELTGKLLTYSDPRLSEFAQSTDKILFTQESTSPAVPSTPPAPSAPPL
jgi:aquaporin related protein